MSQFNPASVQPTNVERMIVDYTHTGNDYFFIASVDELTGIFTADRTLPWTNGHTESVMFSYPHGYPTNLYAEWDGVNTYLIEIVDPLTFRIRDDSNGVTLTSYALGQNVDVTKICIEYNQTKATIDLSSLRLGNYVKTTFSSFGDRSGWRYTNMYFDHDGGSDKLLTSGSVDGRSFETFIYESRYYYDKGSGLLIYYGGNFSYRRWSGGTWVFAKDPGNQRTFDIYKNLKFTKFDTMCNVSNGGKIRIWTS